MDVVRKQRLSGLVRQFHVRVREEDGRAVGDGFGLGVGETGPCVRAANTQSERGDELDTRKSHGDGS